MEKSDDEEVNELQQRIKEIMSDSSIPSSDKMKRVQELYKMPVDSSPVTEQCTQYKRNCSLYCTECEKYYCCRICHDDKENHIMDRTSVMKIKCRHCHVSQGISNECTNCGIAFGEYFCAKCRMWCSDDSPTFHCDDCGMCRKGLAEEFEHCDRCNTCMRKGHECNAEFVCDTTAECPVCLEGLFNTRKPWCKIRCGHAIHTECLKVLWNSNIYACPMCKKSITDMTEYWIIRRQEIMMTPMPEEYRNTFVDITCNDCTKSTSVQFHVLGLECKECGSFNTQKV